MKKELSQIDSDEDRLKKLRGKNMNVWQKCWIRSVKTDA